MSISINTDLQVSNTEIDLTHIYPISNYSIYNANKIQGIPLSLGTITENDGLVFDTNTWDYRVFISSSNTGPTGSTGPAGYVGITGDPGSSVITSNSATGPLYSLQFNLSNSLQGTGNFISDSSLNKLGLNINPLNTIDIYGNMSIGYSNNIYANSFISTSLLTNNIFNNKSTLSLTKQSPISTAYTGGILRISMSGIAINVGYDSTNDRNFIYSTYSGGYGYVNILNYTNISGFNYWTGYVNTGNCVYTSNYPMLSTLTGISFNNVDSFDIPIIYPGSTGNYYQTSFLPKYKIYDLIFTGADTFSGYSVSPNITCKVLVSAYNFFVYVPAFTCSGTNIYSVTYISDTNNIFNYYSGFYRAQGSLTTNITMNKCFFGSSNICSVNIDGTTVLSYGNTGNGALQPTMCCLTAGRNAGVHPLQLNFCLGNTLLNGTTFSLVYPTIFQGNYLVSTI